jgi:hypothetical protein
MEIYRAKETLWHKVSSGKAGRAAQSQSRANGEMLMRMLSMTYRLSHCGFWQCRS